MREKTMLMMIAGLMFWPAVIYIGVVYGWLLQLSILGIIFGIEVQREAIKLP